MDDPNIKHALEWLEGEVGHSNADKLLAAARSIRQWATHIAALERELAEARDKQQRMVDMSYGLEQRINALDRDHNAALSRLERAREALGSTSYAERKLRKLLETEMSRGGIRAGLPKVSVPCDLLNYAVRVLESARQALADMEKEL